MGIDEREGTSRVERGGTSRTAGEALTCCVRRERRERGRRGGSGDNRRTAEGSAAGLVSCSLRAQRGITGTLVILPRDHSQGPVIPAVGHLLGFLDS